MRAGEQWAMFALVAALLSACSDAPGPIDPDPPLSGAIVSFRILPDSVVLAPGETQAFTVDARDASDNPVTVTAMTWTTADQEFATVNSTGLVQAVAPGATWVRAAGAGQSDSARVRIYSPPVQSGTIQVDASVRHQIMLGWEATSQAGQVMCAGFDLYRDVLFDRAVNELGLNRVRLEVRSGSENPQDVFTQFINGQATYDQWRASWYASVNDNADPNTINPSGFHFSELENTIENFVLPMKQRVEANGEDLYINLNFVDFGSSTWDHQSSATEYAEFILATFEHIKGKYGWTPDAVEVILEPNNHSANWTPQQVGQALAAAGQRLAAAGFNPDFIAPSTTSTSPAVTYFDQIITIPGVRNYLKEISYHRYGAPTLSDVRALAQRATQYGLRTAMLERIGSDYMDLHQDIGEGRNSSWSQYALAFCQDTDRGGLYYLIDDSNPAAPQVTMASRTHMLRQYFRFVRSGAARVKATSSVTSLDPLAFVSPDGAYVVVVKATAARTFTVSGLAAGTYGIRYTTASASFQAAPDVTASAGVVTASIPAAGVLTIYRK